MMRSVPTTATGTMGVPERKASRAVPSLKGNI